ncbi:MAG: acyl-CoA thioesterase [Butyricicoccus sp.]
MNPIYSYEHRIQYYETDGMRIVHHSNYIRWMEEARIAFMEDAGYGYECMERDGVSIPVLSVSCEYKSMMRFGQTCRVEVRITRLTPVRMSLSYAFYDAATNELCGTATSGHCFIGANGHPLSLKKHLPEVFDLYRQLVWKPEES